MKARLLAFVLMVLACAVTARSQNGGPLLPKTVSGVNASSSVVVNVTLDPVFLLKGTISGDPASTPDGVTARRTLRCGGPRPVRGSSFRRRHRQPPLPPSGERMAMCQPRSRLGGSEISET